MEKDQALTLTKKAFVGGSHLVITESWVSNGHWAVKKCCLLNASDFQDKQTAQAFLDANGLKDYKDVDMRTDKDVKRLMLTNIPEAKRYERTEYLSDITKPQARIFQNHFFCAAFNDNYVTALGVSALFGFGSIFQNAQKAKDTTILLCQLKMAEAKSLTIVFEK
jgi:hypothetical protein